MIFSYIVVIQRRKPPVYETDKEFDDGTDDAIDQNEISNGIYSVSYACIHNTYIYS